MEETIFDDASEPCFADKVVRRRAQRDPGLERTPDGRILSVGWRLAKKNRPRCGAKTRAGGQCRAPAVPDGRRCRMHGGLSTGPRTPEGKARVAAAQRARWERWRAEHGQV
jgi:hypothetical protein